MSASSSRSTRPGAPTAAAPAAPRPGVLLAEQAVVLRRAEDRWLAQSARRLAACPRATRGARGALGRVVVR